MTENTKDVSLTATSEGIGPSRTIYTLPTEEENDRLRAQLATAHRERDEAVADRKAMDEAAVLLVAANDKKCYADVGELRDALATVTRERDELAELQRQGAFRVNDLNGELIAATARVGRLAAEVRAWREWHRRGAHRDATQDLRRGSLYCGILDAMTEVDAARDLDAGQGDTR